MYSKKKYHPVETCYNFFSNQYEGINRDIKIFTRRILSRVLRIFEITINGFSYLAKRRDLIIVKRQRFYFTILFHFIVFENLRVKYCNF